MIRTQQTPEVLGQRFADRDRQRCTVAQFKHVVERDKPKPQQDPGQLFVNLRRGTGQAVQQRRHLLQDPPDRPAIL